MSKSLDLADKVVVVTGAASGIGRALALLLAKRGCHLALADIDEAGLSETAALVGNRVRVSRHKLDISDRAAVAAFPQLVLSHHGQVDVVINNAGVALGGSFAQLSTRDFDWLMGVNFTGSVDMTRAFLPLLKQRPKAQLVNVSSLFGLIAPPGQTAYAAAKFALRGFSEALRNELLAEGSSVGVTVVHPGGVRTKIAESARNGAAMSAAEAEQVQARFRKALRLSPERAAETIVHGLERRRPRVLVGVDAKVSSLIERLMPVGYWRLLSKLSR